MKATTHIKNLRSPSSHEAKSKVTKHLKKQGGWTIMELTVVLLIVAILGYLAMPRFRAYMIEGRVDSTAKDLGGAVLRIRANAEGAGPTPFAAIATSTLANNLRDRSNALTIAGTGATATVTHSLGATGSAVTVAPAKITTTGDSYTVTFPTVHNGACPGLSTAQQNAAEIIAINGTTVKNNATGVAYNGQTAADACTAGDTNTFVFTYR